MSRGENYKKNNHLKTLPKQPLQIDVLIFSNQSSLPFLFLLVFLESKKQHKQHRQQTPNKQS